LELKKRFKGLPKLCQYPLLAAVLIGLGVTSLSMSSNSIQEVKGFISTLSKKQCEKIALKVVLCSSGNEAKDLAQKELS